MDKQNFDVTDFSNEAWEDPISFTAEFSAPSIPINFDLLPKAVAAMAREVARTTRLPDSLVFGCALGILSAAAGKASAVCIKPGHSFSTALFVLGIAESGGGKTPIVNALKSPLGVYAKNKEPQYDESLAEYRAERSVWEAEQKGINRALEKSVTKSRESTDAAAENIALKMRLKELMESEPKPPMPFTLYATDATSEALMRDMQERNGVYAIVSSEGRQFLDIALGKYNLQGDVQAVLSGIAGDAIVSSRKGSGVTSIEQPYLSVLAFTQPDKLREMGVTPHLKDSGYLQRILFFSAPQEFPDYETDSVPEEISAAYEVCILGICEKRMDEGAYNFTVAERTLWAQFHDGIKRRQAENTHREAFFNAWLQKQPENVARIAMLYHLADDGRTPMMDCLERAIASMETIIIPHFEHALGVIGEDVEVVQARKAWGWIEQNREALITRHGEPIVKASDLQQSGTAGIRNAEEATAVLSSLSNMNYLRMESRKNQRARRSTLFRMRPN